MLLAMAALAAAGATAPAWADVKSGTEAWQRGDYRKAVDEWRPLAIAGDADAQFNLGQAYKLGRGVPVDPALAEQWFGRAAVQGHPLAETNYALTLFQNGKRGDAVPWLEKSVARGEPRAQLVLGTMLFNGDSVKRDWVRAYALVQRAAAAGIPKAAETQGQMDQYISLEDRQQGIALARQYETQAAAQPSYELAGPASGVQPAELPASSAAGGEQGPAVAAVPPAKPRHPAPPAAANTKPLPTQSPEAAPPPPRPAPVAQAAPPRPQPVAATKGWRVQFGAFRDEGNARGLWESLKARVGAVRTLQPFFVKTNGLTRLQAGPLASSVDTARVCAVVRDGLPGTACVPVAP